MKRWFDFSRRPVFRRALPLFLIWFLWLIVLLLTSTISNFSLPYSSHSGYFSEGCPCDSVIRKGKYVSRSYHTTSHIYYLFINILSMCPQRSFSGRRGAFRRPATLSFSNKSIKLLQSPISTHKKYIFKIQVPLLKVSLISIFTHQCHLCRRMAVGRFPAQF